MEPPKSLAELVEEKRSSEEELEELEGQHENLVDEMQDLESRIDALRRILRELKEAIDQQDTKTGTRIWCTIHNLRDTAHSTFDGFSGPDAVVRLCDELLMLNKGQST